KRRSVHRLEVEVRELEIREMLRKCPLLRIDELELVTSRDREGCVGFGAHTDPVEAGYCRLRSIGFDSNAKATAMQCLDGRLVELQYRLTARAHQDRKSVV